MFADPTGRRARIWAVLGGLVGAAAVLYVAAVVFSLLGIPGVPQVGLPGVGPLIERPEAPVRIERTSPAELEVRADRSGAAPTTAAPTGGATPVILVPAAPQEVPHQSSPAPSSPSNPPTTGTAPGRTSPPAAVTGPVATPPLPPVPTTAATAGPTPGSSSATPAASRPSPPSTSGSTNATAPTPSSAPPAAEAPSWGAGGTPDHGPPVSAPGQP